MATLKLSIGSSPYGAECAQLGTDGYFSKAQQECHAFIGQLRRHYAEIHRGAELPCELKVTSNRHDYGIYFDVVAQHAEQDAAGRKAANWLQSNPPYDWDVQAADEIGLFGRQPAAAV